MKKIPYFLLILFSGVLFVTLKRSPATISPLPEDDKIPAVPTKKTETQNKNPDQLKQYITKIADDKWKNYSVLVSGLNGDFEADIGGSVVYDAASVNKIPILAALYHEVNLGNIDLNKVITLQSKDIQDYGTGSIRYDPPGSTYSVKTLARLMMVQSDNTAAYILANLVLSLKNIQTLVTSWGMTQTDMMENTTSNRDICLLMKKIYRGEITSPAYTKEMLEFMTDSLYEDRIPALLPHDVTVFHKIGNGVRLYHDAGIVKTVNTVYYIGIFTSDVPDEKEAISTEAEISKYVFDYLTK